MVAYVQVCFLAKNGELGGRRADGNVNKGKQYRVQKVWLKVLCDGPGIKDSKE